MTSSAILGRAARTLALAIAIAALGGVALGPLTADIAHAQGNSGGNAGGKGGEGKGGGKSASDRSGGKADAERRGFGAERAAEARATGGQGRGALASELKALNAAHASPQALANAAPDSMPGRLAVFKDSYETMLAATTTLNEATAARDAAYAAAVKELVVGSDPYLAAVAELETSQAYIDLVAAVDTATGTLATETISYTNTYMDLTGGVDLSAEADAELLRLLGL